MSARHIFRHMPFSPSDLHQLAWDVTDYPKFIKFITSVRVLSSTKTNMRAEVRVKYKMLRESFITDVDRDLNTGEILVTLVRGPMKHLENKWRFHKLSDGSTLVEFQVRYSFSVSWLGKLFGRKQKRTEHMILNAFEARANTRFDPVIGLSTKQSELAEEIAELQVLSK